MKRIFKLLITCCGLLTAGCGGGTEQPAPKTALLSFSLISSSAGNPLQLQTFKITATLPAGVTPALLSGNALDLRAKNGITAFGSYSASINQLFIAGYAASTPNASIPYGALVELNCSINSGSPTAAAFNSFTLTAAGYDGANTVMFTPESKADVQFGY